MLSFPSSRSHTCSLSRLCSAKDAIRNDTVAQLLQRRQEFDERENNRAVNEFRALHQQPPSQRKSIASHSLHDVRISRVFNVGEWDLNDPDYLKKDMPARVSDDDPRCGLASLQKFQGEDLNAPARTKYQQEQLREWSRMQQDEQRLAQQRQQAADHLFHAKQNELDQRAIELQQAEEQCRRAINESTKNYNAALVGCHLCAARTRPSAASALTAARNGRTSRLEEASGRVRQLLRNGQYDFQ